MFLKLCLLYEDFHFVLNNKPLTSIKPIVENMKICAEGRTSIGKTLSTHDAHLLDLNVFVCMLASNL